MALGLPCHNGNNAVIRKFIHQLAVQGDPVRLFCHGTDVILSAAQSGQVELVALVGQLSNALHIHRLKGADGRRHFQAVQILAVIGKSCLGLGGLGAGMVLRGLFQVVAGKDRRFKVPAVVQHLDVVFGTIQHRGGHAGQLGGHNGTLRRIVISKHKAVGAKAELCGDGFQVLIFRIPVGLDADKIIRVQHAVRVVQAGQGVGFVIFGIHRQHHADGLQGFAVALEFSVHLAFRHLGANGNAVHTVIAHNAAPESVIQIQHQGFFVAAIQGFDDVCHAVCQRRNRIQAHGVLVHMPEERIPPGSQAVICAEIVNIIDIKILMRGGIGVKALVQAAEIVGTAMRVPDIAVAHQAVVGAVKVILDDGAVEFGFQRLPHLLKAAVLGIQHGVNFRLRGGRCGEIDDVAPVGVDINDIGVEPIQLRRAEHGVLPILAILALVELRLNAVLQQKQAQLVCHLIGGGTAQDGDALLQRVRVLGQQFLAQAALFAQQRFGIQRVVKTIHIGASLQIIFRAYSFCRASSSVMAIWSGQLVGLEPHRVPFMRSMASSAFMPFSSWQMPFRLPLQPPSTSTDSMVWSGFSSTLVITEQVPLLRRS